MSVRMYSFKIILFFRIGFIHGNGLSILIVSNSFLHAIEFSYDELFLFSTTYKLQIISFLYN